MLEKFRNPKNVKTISLLIAAIFVLGCFTIALSAGGFNNIATAAASDSAIGVVDYQVLVSQSPKMAEARTKMQEEVKKTRAEFEEKSKNMNNEEKERYYHQMQQRLEMQQKNLLDPVMESINAIVKKIADKKGLSVVVDKNSVIYGGTDITTEVAKDMQTAK